MAAKDRGKIIQNTEWKKNIYLRVCLNKKLSEIIVYLDRALLFPAYKKATWTVAARPWNSPGQNNRSLLQGIFQTQGSSPGLLHCKQILYHLSHQGSQNSLGKKVQSWKTHTSQFQNLLQRFRMKIVCTSIG